MKIIFFGNTKYSVFGLEIINKKFPVSLIVTISDRPSGRKRELKPNPVKKFAQDHHIPVLETDSLDKFAVDQIAKERPDFLIVEDYGLILPESLLETPRFAPLNIHHSLLPKYRGPSPAPSAILNGEKISGVTVISMTELVDVGDMLAQREYQLAKDATTDSLLTKLNIMGGELVLKVIGKYLAGKEKPVKQDDKQASYTKRLTKQDGYIDINSPPDPQTLDRMIRAYYPWPTVWTEIVSKGPASQARRGEQGVIGSKLRIKFLPSSVDTSTHGHIDPFLIQPEGKRPMSIKEFKNGYPKIFEKISPLFDYLNNRSQVIQKR